MTEITDAVLLDFFVEGLGTKRTGYKISDVQRTYDKRIHEHYVNFSKRRISPYTDESRTTHCYFIKVSNFEHIKTAVSSLPSSIADYLLLVLWLREVTFEMKPLEENDIFSFVQSGLALSNSNADTEKVKAAFYTLWQEKYFQDSIVNNQNTGTARVYSLAPKGKEYAEKVFNETKRDISAHVESLPVVQEIDIADYLPQIHAASGRGVPSIVEAYNASIDDVTEQTASTRAFLTLPYRKVF